MRGYFPCHGDLCRGFGKFFIPFFLQGLGSCQKLVHTKRPGARPVPEVATRGRRRLVHPAKRGHVRPFRNATGILRPLHREWWQSRRRVSPKATEELDSCHSSLRGPETRAPSGGGKTRGHRGETERHRKGHRRARNRLQCRSNVTSAASAARYSTGLIFISSNGPLMRPR